MDDAGAGADVTLRPDLAVVEVDGDLVVYDPASAGTHVLSGGAVVVWVELDGASTEGLAERVAERVGLQVDDVREQVDDVVRQFGELGLLSGAAADGVRD